MMAMKKLNNRPRKTLGFLTPNEVFFENYKIALTT
jgi:IS30 family transposase